MGNTIFIKDRRVCVNPLHTQFETIQKIRPPTTAKQCKCFAGMVNFVSIICPDCTENVETHIGFNEKR